MWLQLFVEDYDARCAAYITAMKEMFKKIPETMIKALTPEQKVHKFMTDIGGGWYMEKFSKGPPPLNRLKISKNNKRSRIK